MSRGYRVVYPDFWESPRVLSMKPNERLLFLYLVTAPDAHYSGVYYRPIPIMMFHTGLSEKDVRSALNTLSDTLCVRYDEKTFTVWVINAARKNVASDQQRTGVVNHFKQNIRSWQILEEFSTTYPEILSSLDTLSHTLPNRDRDTGGDTTGDRKEETGKRREDTIEEETSGVAVGKTDGFDLGSAKLQTPVRKRPANIPYQEVVDSYRNTCTSLRRCDILNEERRRAIANAWKLLSGDMDQILTLFQKAQTSAFLRGERNDPNGKHKNWRADLTFVLSDKQIAKILEGAYDDGRPAKTIYDEKLFNGSDEGKG